MAILQISKIQQRSGNLVDLPQLDDAEFGWATDSKRLFIGKATPNENIEVLTAYSQINFSQINGTAGNLNISNVTLADGQLLSYDGSEWVNKGGTAGGLLTLGNVSNVKITGGAIGYVLETDGLGNLAWTPKSSITAFLENVTQADPAVVTTTQDNYFTQGASITVTNVTGMTQLNGNVFYVDVLTSNTFALYHDSGLANTVDSTGYGTFPYTTVSATSTLTDQITVGNSVPFTANDPVVFAGNLGNSTIVVGQTYYIKTKPSGTTITISETAGGNIFDPGTEASPSSARVYVTGGRAVSLVTGGGSSSLAAGGTDTQVQYNDTNLLMGNADFTFNNSTKLLTLNGNANVGNLNATGVSTATRFISNTANGTPPLQVTSFTRVANLSVAYSNVSDFGIVTATTTGTYYPILASGNTTGNYALASNANMSFNAATGNLSVTLLNVTSNANTGNLGTARVIATGNISGTQLISNVATGTAPLVVTSTTQVANLSVATAGSATTAGTVTTAAQPNITSVGTLTSLGVNGTVTAVAFTANTGVFTGNGSGLSAIAGANVSGAVAFATTANAVAGANVSGAVAFATTANAVAGANVSGAVAFATTANAVAGANVSGAVAFATTANAVAGANVSGTVANATFATSAGSATSATSATTAGTVTTAAQGNITSVGTLTALSVSGALTTTNITAGANTTAGTITGNWTLTAGSRLQATYADLAEYYEADVTYEPGTVLMFGGDKEVTIAEDDTNRVAGVVSSNPAYLMNVGCDGIAVAIALQGRVPCKVRGSITKGDMIVSAGNGFAKSNQSPTIGTVIGKALENFDGHEGIIEVAVGRL